MAVALRLISCQHTWGLILGRNMNFSLNQFGNCWLSVMTKHLPDFIFAVGFKNGCKQMNADVSSEEERQVKCACVCMCVAGGTWWSSSCAIVLPGLYPTTSSWLEFRYSHQMSVFCFYFERLRRLSHFPQCFFPVWFGFKISLVIC